jgi:NAD(P)-dependent dehydrogenase (short-subunit alcohol dehydrogenase family)
VVITGASSGIGRATARAFAREGARLVLGARNTEQLEEAAASMRHGGREARAVTCNVVVPQQVERLIDAAVSRWDRLDVVVANAGVGLTAAVTETTRSDFRHLLDVNVMGVFNTVQAALPKMLAQGSGTIVVVSSVLGYRGIPRYGAYCASKAALNALADAWRVELAPRGVHVLLVAPGLTDTPFAERRLGKHFPEPMRSRVKAMSADDVGEAIVLGVLRRRSRVTLTSAGRFLASLARHAPSLTDRGVARWHARNEQAVTRGVPPDAAPATTP